MTFDYQYPVSDFKNGSIDQARLTAEVSAAGITTALISVTVEDGTATLTFANPLSSGEKTLLDNDASPAGGVVGSHWSIKAKRYRSIDLRTQTLIESGFSHASKMFSASEDAQRKWLFLYLNRTNLTYPVSLSVLNDSEAPHSFADQAALEAGFADLCAHVKATVDSGLPLKAQIRAAADKTAVDAVVDTRT